MQKSITKIFFMSVLFIALGTIANANPLKLKYSFGANNFVVDDVNTFGVNGGIHVGYFPNETTYHKGKFETFVEYDDEELDPDHIPVWFSAKYRFSTEFISINEFLSLNGVVNFDWKMNTVSSIEQYLKTGAGVTLPMEYGSLELVPKVLAGTYYLEIDDDVPKSRGFSRSDLDVGYRSAYMYGADLTLNMTNNLSLGINYEEWHDGDDWLEENIIFALTYVEENKYDVMFSVENTNYNLTEFRKNGTDVLPWNEDTLFKFVLSIPFN